nr:hypothetical protein [uncultured Caproiciproducens sp.]
MNQIEIVCIIAGAVGTIFGVCGFIFPLLAKKGINVEGILQKVDSGLEVAGKAIDAVKAISPNLPYISTADAIIDYSRQGVQQAEQLYNANKISADARKSEAIKLTKELLKAAKVDITPEIETVIEGCVEAAVYVLPQTHSGENATRYSLKADSSTASQAAQEAKAVQDNAAKAINSALEALQTAANTISPKTADADDSAQPAPAECLNTSANVAANQTVTQ